MNGSEAQTAVLEVRDLEVTFFGDRGTVPAVRGCSFSVAPGETLGLVGESGCGKSVTGLGLLRLLPRSARAAGTVLFDGENVAALPPEALRRVRGAGIGIIFQDPLSALNPVLSVGDQMLEALRVHESGSGAEARSRAEAALRDVGLADAKRMLGCFPHELSGGMRQRVLIAMAILLRPRLIIADEPTTALDVTVQAQIIELLRRLKRQYALAMILISHDLGVVAQLADRVAIMYAGRIVESGPMRDVYRQPRHPYTAGLLRSIPGSPGAEAFEGIPGNVPDPMRLPSGCAFHPRCPRRLDRCVNVVPETAHPAGRAFACHNPEPGEAHGAA